MHLEQQADHSRFDLVAATLLAAAALASVWSAYQVSRWTGEQAARYDRAGALRAESIKAQGRAVQQMHVDATTFVTWALAHGEPTAAMPAFERQRSSTETSVREAERLVTEAAGWTTAAQRAGRLANDFVLSVVLFTTAGFFGGLQNRAKRTVVRGSLIAASTATFIFALGFMLPLPQLLGR